MQWQDDELQYVIDNYQEISYLQIAQHIGRPEHQVKAKLHRLGLYKQQSYRHEYIIDGDTTFVPLSSKKYHGLYAIIDTDQISKVDMYRWHRTGSGPFYARGTHFGNSIMMHRLLFTVDPGYQVDHKDRNGLNNRLENLRQATASQNMANTGDDSRIHGVKQYKDQWRTNYRGVNLGTFETRKEAAAAYNKAAFAAFGEFARLNDLESITD